ncbi:Coatomer subunit zeta-2 [Zea mays]|nr:Coatomer subunit zeta-2 [Zea mays]
MARLNLYYLVTRGCRLSRNKFSLMHIFCFFAAEITLFDGYIVVYKFVHDLHFFVTAGDDENELILASVLHGFSDSVGLLLRGDVEKRTALENLDLILLCIDEIVDGG